MDGLEQIGPRLRAARKARGWTLDELASRADVSASTLSRLESGKRQASLELLLPLVRQLGIRIDDLLPDAHVDPRVRRPAVTRHGHVVAPLTRESSPVQTYKVTFPPADAAPAARVHDGFEWFYVLSGRVRLLLGENETVLSRGEAAEFDTRIPHSISAVGTRAAEVISIFSASGERMHTRIAAD